MPFWNVHIFGALQGNVLFNTARPIAPGIPLLLAPGSIEQENTVDVFARSSSLGAAFTGPEIGTLQAGGVVLFLFYNDALIVDRYGLLPLQAFGELKNEDYRFAAGLQFNVFAPNVPTMLTFGSMLGSGNAGNNFVGQVRVERFLHPSDNSDWTIQAAISDPVATGVVSNSPLSVLVTRGPALRITEDNGWPTLEGRIAYSVGKKSLVGLEQKRALEMGVSAVGGQLRSVLVPQPNVVANTYGACSDFRWSVSDRFGFLGEAFVGEGLGFQNGGILQSVNSATFRGIRTRGAWGEAYYYLTPCLHTHSGGGIDDPLDQDIAATQVTRNTTLFSNVIWDATKQLRFGVEFTYRQTNYVALNDNHGCGFHFQTQWSF
ncbi:MAG: hypothetical protein K8U03_10865 [Planctomycetia bacterium]|nr:hypothetical protein [Planctomycetia bacterium]